MDESSQPKVRDAVMASKRRRQPYDENWMAHNQDEQSRLQQHYPEYGQTMADRPQPRPSVDLGFRDSPISFVGNQSWGSEVSFKDVQRRSVEVHRSFIRRMGNSMASNKITLFVLAALVLAVIVAAACRSAKVVLSRRQLMYVEFWGMMYVRALQALTIPLMVTSIVTSITSVDVRYLRMLGLRTVTYFLFTTLLAVSLGLFLVIVIQPSTTSVTSNGWSWNLSQLAATIEHILVRMAPENLVGSCMFQEIYGHQKPIYTNVTFSFMRSSEASAAPYNTGQGRYKNIHWQPNHLGLVVFSIAFAVAALNCKEHTELIKDLFEAMFRPLVKCVMALAWLSPFGIFFLVLSTLLRLESYEDLSSYFVDVAKYCLTIFLGLFVHALVVLPCLYFLCTYKNPYKFMFNMGEALFTAFATASSLATLPTTIKCLESKNEIPPAVARFVAAFGACVNMDGSALYAAVVPIYLMNRMGGDSFAVHDPFLISITATLTSIGTAGISQSGLVNVLMMLSFMQMESTLVTHFVVPLDWLVDRVQTVVNVLSDSFGAAAVYGLLSGSTVVRILSEQHDKWI